MAGVSLTLLYNPGPVMNYCSNIQIRFLLQLNNSYLVSDTLTFKLVGFVASPDLYSFVYVVLGFFYYCIFFCIELLASLFTLDHSSAFSLGDFLFFITFPNLFFFIRKKKLKVKMMISEFKTHINICRGKDQTGQRILYTCTAYSNAYLCNILRYFKFIW